MRITLTLILSFFYLTSYMPSNGIIYILESEPIFKSEFIKFADHLGYIESRNDPNAINRQGCFGEHQWKESTLQAIGYRDITLEKFKKDKSIFPRKKQLMALSTLVEINKKLLRRYGGYVGQTIDGARITNSGLIAACHLGGIRGVRLFLQSNGGVNKKDINGTSIRFFIKKFQGYNI
jgi:hypothetical protein